jgi:hypothetical protein
LVNAEFEAAGVTDDEIHKITWQNSCRFFGVQPFAELTRDKATVGSLRARAMDVDTSETSRAQRAERFALHES